MDFSGLDIGAIGAAIVAIIKSFHSDSKTAAVKRQADNISDDRVTSKKSYDERFAETDVKIANIEKRLDRGDARFGCIEKKIDENFRDLKKDFSTFGGKVNYIMGLLKGIEQESRKTRKRKNDD